MKKSFKISFDVCTFCNHKCTFCSNADNRTIKDYVKRNDFIKVMDNIFKYITIEKLSLSAKGEVLLNKELEEIIKSTKKKYNLPYVYFSTNGLLLNQKRALSILKSGIDSIKFSINAFDKESYKRVHQKDDFDEVICNLKNLLLLKKEKYPHLKVFISAVNDMDEIAIKEIFQVLLEDLYIYVDGVIRYKLQFTAKNTNKDNILIDAQDCLISPFKEIYINSDCTLGFCCKDYFDEINFGSLLEHDFMKLYNGVEYKKMRQRFLENNFEKDTLCYNCLVFEGLNK